MYAAVSQFEGAVSPTDLRPHRNAEPQDLERAEGAVRLSFVAYGGQSRLQRGYQGGSLKVRFPRLYDTDVPEAVLLNTAGGITGGDRFSVEAEIGSGAAATLTSQAAERVYRSVSGEGRVDVSLNLGPGARLDWLPQETIVFDAGRLSRTLSVEMADDSRLMLCEAVILGRAAHGETMRQGFMSDRWRVRRGGRLVYADNLMLDPGAGATTQGSATLGGGRGFATLLIVRPSAESAIDTVRAVLSECPVTGGASAWNGMLSARLVAADGAALRASIIRLCAATGTRLPRAWSV
jgi:urease accessory protein